MGDTVTPVEHVQWIRRPGPGVTGSTRTVMIAAFSGWNDAGDAASGAIEHLWDAWEAQPIATVDPEEFMDFSATRPIVTVEAGVPAPLDWPTTEIGWCTPTGARSVVLVQGPEPNNRWRTYCATLLEVADQLGCSAVITLGALLSEVPHSRPTPVFSTAHEPQLIDSLSLPSSNYQGPTGVPAALHEAAHAGGLESVALWAATPAYAAGVPSAKAALALVRQVSAIIGVRTEVGDLTEEAEEYESQLDSLVSEDEDTIAYLHSLEQDYDADSASLRPTDDLVQEVEDFLKDQ